MFFDIEYLKKGNDDIYLLHDFCRVVCGNGVKGEMVRFIPDVRVAHF